MGSKSDDDHTNPSISLEENNDTATSSSSLSNVTIRQQLQEPLLPPLLIEHQDRKTSSSRLSNLTIRQQLQEPLLPPLLTEHQDRKTSSSSLSNVTIRQQRHESLLPPLPTSSSSLRNVTTRQRHEPLLPPLLAEHRDRKTLVLDLDETLIHASRVPIPHYDFLNESGVIYFLKRPGVDEFLEAAAKLFEVVVFTAGSRGYADPVLDRLDVNGTLITHRLFNPQCTRGLLPTRDGRQMTATVKDLRRLGRELSKTIIVDNSPVAYLLQPQNAVPISSYVEYQPNDCELSRVMSILRTLVDRNDDVREVLQQLQH